MNLNTILLGAALGFAALPAFAEIIVDDPYARASSPTAQVGAAFMAIRNSGNEDDRLVAAASGAARRVELHTHVMTNGVAKMMRVDEGFVVPANGEVLLQRGGKHVMMMGLTAAFIQDETISLTLTFEKAGEMIIVVPIDNVRMDNAMSDMSDN